MDLLRPFRVRRNVFSGLLHIALMTIVIGACVTHFWGVQGEIHLRADKAETLTINPSALTESKALSLFLWDFQIVFAEDGQTPVDYITELRILDRSRYVMAKAKGENMPVDEGTIRMNKPLKYNGWRFCQSDYDSDRMGVVLAYNYDPWGTGITYTGYALLLLAMIGFFFQKNTYFRVLWKELTSSSRFLGKTGVCAFAALIVVLALVMTKVVTPKPPLQPVLQTPLLGIHVSVIMLAYTLFAIMMINGIIGICMNVAESKATGTRKDRLQISGQRLQKLSRLFLYPALFCLTSGIFIGAVWANLSWGRYWGWDPKETWALITMLVYACQLHWPLIIPKLHIAKHKSQIVYHIISVINFFFVLFTYFGVSYLLGGLHSYA